MSESRLSDRARERTASGIGRVRSNESQYPSAIQRGHSAESCQFAAVAIRKQSRVFESIHGAELDGTLV